MQRRTRVVEIRLLDPVRHQAVVAALQGLHASGEAMDKTGETAKKSLWDNAHSAKPSVSGAAYKVLLDAADRSRSDFSADPVLERAKKTYAEIDQIAAGFGDCAEETAFRQGKTTAHVPDYRNCERVRDERAACEVLHDYRASVIRHHDGPYNLRPCGDGCVELWIGKVGNNYWQGWCAIHEVSTQVRVDNPRAIVSARLEYVKWDNYMQIRIGEPGRETTVWSGPYGARFPPETEGRCELLASWERNPGVDVTRYFRDVAPGAVQLSAPSSLVLDGGRYASAARFLADTGDIETNATLRGEETITLRANDGGIVNRGRIAGDKGVTLRTAKTVRNRGEVLSPTTIALDSAGGVTNHFGGQITSGSSLALNADTLDNAGTIAAKTIATIAVSCDLKNSGSLLAEQALRVNGRDTAALGTLSNPGETAQINGGEHLDIAATALVNEGQIGAAGGALTVDAATLTNSYSQIAANSDIRLRADTVDNSGRDLIETVEKPM